jgi:hypothetical protein
MFGYLAHEEFDLAYCAEGAFHAAGARGFAFLGSRWATASEAQKLKMIDMSRSVMRRRDSDETLRSAAMGLARRGLSDRSAAVRLEAAKALVDDPASIPGVLDTLVGLLSEDVAEIRRSAGYQLKKLGAKAKSVRGRLEALRDHPDEKTRRYVRRTLEKIEDAE